LISVLYSQGLNNVSNRFEARESNSLANEPLP